MFYFVSLCYTKNEILRNFPYVHTLRFGARRLWLPANGLRLTDSFFKTRRSCFKNLRHYSRVFLILNLERTMAMAFLHSFLLFLFQPAKLGQLSHAIGLSLNWRPVVRAEPFVQSFFGPNSARTIRYVTIFFFHIIGKLRKLWGLVLLILRLLCYLKSFQIDKQPH